MLLLLLLLRAPPPVEEWRHHSLLHRRRWQCGQQEEAQLVEVAVLQSTTAPDRWLSSCHASRSCELAFESV